MKTLYIGSFALPALAHLDLRQRYDPIGPESIRRAVTGRAIKQMTWEKTRITTSASGWVPSGLQSLDFRAQHLLKCIRSESIPAGVASRQATLPAGKYRTDAGHEPWGLAQMPSGDAVRCSVSLAGDVATASVVPSAVAYQIAFFPQFMVYLTRPPRDEYNWELVAEEA